VEQFNDILGQKNNSMSFSGGYGFTIKKEYEQIKGVSHIISLEIKEMFYAKRTFSY